MREDAMVPLTEAAVAIGISRDRALRRIQSRRLEGVKIDGYWFVPRAALERALSEIGPMADRSREPV